MEWEHWPNCAIEGCPNKCCLRLRSKYCWPHTRGDEPFDAMMDRLREEETVGA